MSRSVALYLHAHQPYRMRHYTIFDAGSDHGYFNDETPDKDTNNRFIIDKVSDKSYLPTNSRLKALIEQHPEFCLSLSITGTLIEQLEQWRPDVLKSFQELVATGRVEILAETYHHSLAFFYSRKEFEMQVKMHRELVERVFKQTPKAFRNTELAYNNDLAFWADKAGYKGILAEGWDPVLGWRSPNFVYRPAYTEQIRLLMKNYRLSDDLAFRFSDKKWAEWPLTAEKYAHWLNELPSDQPLVNLFMDYETFGEHQWEDSGIFDFIERFPAEFLKTGGNRFMTISQAIDELPPVDFVDVPDTITWADAERDLTAWVGNAMQQEAIKHLYDLQEQLIATNDWALIEDWRKLQTSDHLYYMCTKWFTDGDVHAYFSPYETPYEAFMNFMNCLRDLEYRVSKAQVA